MAVVVHHRGAQLSRALILDARVIRQHFRKRLDTDGAPSDGPAQIREKRRQGVRTGQPWVWQAAGGKEWLGGAADEGAAQQGVRPAGALWLGVGGKSGPERAADDGATQQGVCTEAPHLGEVRWLRHRVGATACSW
eukprot:359351-Chlamydomonas_euryale.AAC.1